ncbi:hypothetical protein [Dermacoccus nishinomiyaensis]|uniref:hypothetical protein n=1 Tax=Dermacoccus nishinomiyaensis TaxID=1274 RepID=UPI0013F47444|nr:hypothetical protein [Dermacoccus nishinomiyaensis]NHC31931.1 hypothetical protein [Dermacoccus nishinomiyaensis]
MKHENSGDRQHHVHRRPRSPDGLFVGRRLEPGVGHVVVHGDGVHLGVDLGVDPLGDIDVVSAHHVDGGVLERADFHAGPDVEHRRPHDACVVDGGAAADIPVGDAQFADVQRDLRAPACAG